MSSKLEVYNYLGQRTTIHYRCKIKSHSLPFQALPRVSLLLLRRKSIWFITT